MKHIVVIGGGTGTHTLLSGLKKYPVRLSVIVSTADDGGSTGVLRRELGVMPPGDIRQVLVGLSEANQDIKDLFSYRFSEGLLKGHVAGNIIVAGLEKFMGNIDQAIAQASKLLKVSGLIIPVTTRPTALTAVLQNGLVIKGEHNIDEPKGNRKFRIKSLELKPAGPVNPKALAAIKSADLVVFGPGDLYTSILPNVLATGMRQALAKSKAKKVLVTNIMTKHGQTDGFKLNNFVSELQKYLGQTTLDIVIANNEKPATKWLTAYKKERAVYVEPNIEAVEQQGIKVVAGNFLSEFAFRKASGDTLKRSFLRHDSNKLAKIVYQLTAK